MQPADNNTVTTVPLTAGPSAYLPHIARRIAWRLWCLPALALVPAVYGLAADWRWTVVALMVLLLIYPAVMTIAVLRYATGERVMRRARAACARIDSRYAARLCDEAGAEVESLPAPAYISRSGRRLLLQYSSAPDDILLL